MSNNFYSKNVKRAIHYLWIEMDVNKKEEATELLWESARIGDADAFFFLSKCYMGDKEIFPGLGFEKDDALAIVYRQRSLELGSVLALFEERGIKGSNMNLRLFQIYYSPKELWDVIVQRAKKGDVFAQVALGDMYCNFRLAKFWELPYQLDNMFGNAFCMETVKWYEKALKKGFVKVITNSNFPHEFRVQSLNK